MSFEVCPFIFLASKLSLINLLCSNFLPALFFQALDKATAVPFTDGTNKLVVSYVAFKWTIHNRSQMLK